MKFNYDKLQIDFCDYDFPTDREEFSLDAFLSASKEIPTSGYFVLPYEEIACQGPDTLTFLQGLTTNDVFGVNSGKAIRTLFLYSSGKILCDSILRKEGDVIYISVEADVKEKLLKYLDYFHITEKVEFSESEKSNYYCLAYGAQITDGLLIKEDFYDLLLAPANKKPEEFFSDNFQRLDLRQFLGARFFLNFPLAGLDYKNEPYPHEIGWEKYVSFVKGCYIGQEPVSRMENKVRAAKVIRNLDCQKYLSPGEKIYIDEKEAGEIRTSSKLPFNGMYYSFGMVRTKLFKDENQRLANSENVTLELHASNNSN